MVRTTCPRCDAALVVDDTDAYERTICGVCQKEFVAVPDRPSSRRQRDEEEDEDEQPRRRRRQPGGEGLAGTSLVLGIISLLIFCLWPIGLPVSLVGMVLGAAALRTRSRRLAIAGLVLSTVGLIFATGFAVVTVAGVVKAEYDRGSPTNPKRPVFKGGGGRE